MESSSISINITEWDSHLEKDVIIPEEGASRTVAENLSKTGMLEIVELAKGLQINAKSYVGKIDLGILTVTIHPKIDGIKLLNLLRYAYGLRELKLYSDIQYSPQQNSFQDLILHQLAVEISNLISHGLNKKYSRMSSNLSSPKGRIDFQKITSQSGLAEATLPCTYYLRLEDCLINQVILEGLNLGTRITTDLLLKTRLRRLASIIQEDVSTIRLNAEVMIQLHREMDRLSAAYRPSISLIEMLLASLGISLDKDAPDTRVPGFLFDMNMFFQALLSRFLKENLPNYRIRDEFSLRKMMHYIPNYNPQNRRPPTPRPDYVISNKDGKVISIIDAKYRDIWKNHLPRYMLYQLSIYSLSHGDIKSSTILYPSIDEKAKEERIQIEESIYGKHLGIVILRPVNMSKIEELISRKKTASVEREMSNYARWMAFGN
jgi:5-methylcytosine-specific restriction enzyme subunit McrC